MTNREVRFSPRSAGTSTRTLTISSNAGTRRYVGRPVASWNRDRARSRARVWSTIGRG